MRLLAKLDGAVQLRGVPFHLVLCPLRLAPEQVKGCPRREQPLMLLPALPSRNFGLAHSGDCRKYDTLHLLPGSISNCEGSP